MMITNFENSALEGRSTLAQRFSAGKSATNDASPGRTTELLRTSGTGVENRASSSLQTPSPEGRHALLLALPGTLLALAIAFGTLLHAQDARPPRTPITRVEVWQAVTAELRQRGVREEQLLGADEIDLPALIPAAASRTLRVSMVCWDADLGRAQFQLECREPGECVPFLAYAAAGRSTAMGSEKIAGSSCRNSRQRFAPVAAQKAIVRSGDRATVLFRGSQLNLTAQVTCLERGAAGDVIRVRNQDGQVFRARISAPARLEALSQ